MENKISVVVPTYNSAATLEKCIVSLISQTVKPLIIIADGGSTDDTMNIVHKYEQHIYKSFSERDQGVFDAWNKGLSHVTTPWVAFLGSDDFYYDNNSLQHLVDAIDKANDDVGVIYPHIYKFISGELVNSDDNQESSFPIGSVLKHMPFTHCGSAHKVDVFSEVGTFDSTFRIAGDYDFVNRMLKNYTIKYAGDYKVCIGVEGLSMSRRFRIRLISELMRIYKKNGLWGVNASSGYLILKYCVHSLLALTGK